MVLTYSNDPELAQRETLAMTPEDVLSKPVKPARRFVPQLVETTTRSRRRAPPAPIDTSRTSSSRPVAGPIEPNSVTTQATKKARRRSREKFDQDWDEWANKAEKEFHKRKPEGASEHTENRRPRRFSPQLLETVQRSHKADGAQSSSPSPDHTPIGDFSHNPLFEEIQRETSPVKRRRPSWGSLRSTHSFRVPELDPIESSESEPASPHSPSLSFSATSKEYRVYKEATRMQESAEERYDYFLDLAAKAAEAQLREQAMAAFPNDDRHEPVEHYIDADEEEPEAYTEDIRGRRESFDAKNNWDLLEMRRYREKLEKEKEAKLEAKKRLAAHLNKLNKVEPAEDRWGRASAVLNFPGAQELAFQVPEDDTLDSMRRSARPPMLGNDIEIPRCTSPEPARFDTTQGCDAVRIATEYLSEQCHQAERGEGLWCGQNLATDRPSLYSTKVNSPATSRSPSPGLACGLWGGSCARTGRTPPRGPTGLYTPRFGTHSPASPAPTPVTRSLLPPTPPACTPDFASIEQKLATEVSIEEEFGDCFVTQVYNYLSLGYPSIGRMFDEELSKISGIPVSELRQDDHLTTSRGYIRLGEDECASDEIKEEGCMRWRALRIYVKVWARQHPTMASEAAGAATVVRRGSWAQ